LSGFIANHPDNYSLRAPSPSAEFAGLANVCRLRCELIELPRWTTV